MLSVPSPAQRIFAASCVLPQRWHRPSLPGGSEELLSLKNVLLISQHHLTKTVKSETSLSSGEDGMGVPGWDFQRWRCFGFTPQFWAGFGVPLCCTRTQHWEGSREGKKQGKTKKKPLQPRAGSIPCLFLPAQLQLWDGFGILDGPCKDLGFWFADPALLQGSRTGGSALCHRAIGHQVPPANPTAAINPPWAPRPAPPAKINVIKTKNQGAWAVLHRCHHQQGPDTATTEQSWFPQGEGPGLGSQPPLNQARI